MPVKQQIKNYIASLPPQKADDLQELDRIIQKIMPGCELSFLDGRNSDNKVVSNPNIGYGKYTMKYSDGKTREFYQVGTSANTTGISVYVLGIPDKTYLAKTFGKQIGKANVTGYCIKFKALRDISIDVLEQAIRAGLAATSR
jgi:hypothetical protein